MQVALNPPVHGDWDDVNHLMKVYMPLYEKYEASCGLKAESIFSAYSATQKKRLAKLFTKQSDGVIIRTVTVEDLQRLSNEDFTTMLCKEKGYKTSTLTEDALKPYRDAEATRKLAETAYPSMEKPKAAVVALKPVARKTVAAKAAWNDDDILLLLAA
jgi:hypothetical protein